MTKICENPDCGREFEPAFRKPNQRYCKTFGVRCRKRHYAALNRDAQKMRKARYDAKVRARMEEERVAQLGDPRMCALPECDAIFTPHPNALNTHKYCSTDCSKAAKLKGDRERLTSDPSKVPWGDYRGQNIPAVYADRVGRHVQFKTFGI